MISKNEGSGRTGCAFRSVFAVLLKCSKRGYELNFELRGAGRRNVEGEKEKGKRGVRVKREQIGRTQQRSIDSLLTGFGKVRGSFYGAAG